MSEWEWFLCLAASATGAITFLKFSADSVTAVVNSLETFERREKKRRDKQIRENTPTSGSDEEIITIAGKGEASPT